MITDETKERILAAAYDLFVEKGYQGSSMRDIATKAGIKAGSIYNHFDGKEQIFEAVFVEKHPIFRILAILDGVRGDNAEELLTNAVSRLNKELQNTPGLLNLFFVEFVEMDGKHIPQAIEKNFPFDSIFMKQVFKMKEDIRDILANIMFNWLIGDTNPRRWGTQSEMTDVLLRGILKD